MPLLLAEITGQARNLNGRSVLFSPTQPFPNRKKGFAFERKRNKFYVNIVGCIDLGAPFSIPYAHDDCFATSDGFGVPGSSRPTAIMHAIADIASLPYVLTQPSPNRSKALLLSGRGGTR